MTFSPPSPVAPDLVLIAGSESAAWSAAACSVAHRLAAGREAIAVTCLSRRDCRPMKPFAGALFDIMAATAAAGQAGLVGLVVPLASPTALAAGPVIIADHVDLALRSPLLGAWPAGRERTFPSMSDVYAADVAERLLVPSTSAPGERIPAPGTEGTEAAVYSRIAVAGVADLRRLSVWEEQQARAAGLTAVADCLVAPVVIAACYGLTVAGVGVPVETECSGDVGER